MFPMPFFFSQENKTSVGEWDKLKFQLEQYFLCPPQGTCGIWGEEGRGKAKFARGYNASPNSLRKLTIFP